MKLRLFRIGLERGWPDHIKECKFIPDGNTRIQALGVSLQAGLDHTIEPMKSSPGNLLDALPSGALSSEDLRNTVLLLAVSVHFRILKAPGPSVEKPE